MATIYVKYDDDVSFWILLDRMSDKKKFSSSQICDDEILYAMLSMSCKAGDEQFCSNFVYARLESKTGRNLSSSYFHKQSQTFPINTLNYGLKNLINSENSFWGFFSNNCVNICSQDFHCFFFFFVNFLRAACCGIFFTILFRRKIVFQSVSWH